MSCFGDDRWSRFFEQGNAMSELPRAFRRIKHSQSACSYALYREWDLDAYAKAAGWAAVATCSVMSRNRCDVVESTNFVVVARDMQQRFGQAVSIQPFYDYYDELEDILIAVDAGNKAAVAAAEDWANRVEHYGVADASKLAAVNAAVNAALADEGLDPDDEADLEAVEEFLEEFLQSYFDNDE
jgi:hypothetical protein